MKFILVRVKKMSLVVGTSYSLSILPGQVFVKEAICNGNFNNPVYYFRDNSSSDCNYSNTGACLQGFLNPGETGTVENFQLEMNGVTPSPAIISFDTSDSKFIITDTGTYEVSYDISHFQAGNGYGTTVNSYFEDFSSNTIIIGSESEKTLRNNEDYDTSPGKFTLTISAIPYELRLIHGYMNTADLSLVPVPRIFVYSRGTVVKFTKLN